MAQAFRIETLDRSGRWYLTPGARSIYDLRIRNDSKNAVDCSLVVEDPATGVSVEPNAFPLRGHEVRTVTVTFAPDATSVRSHRVLLSLHADDDGRLLATFEHPLVATGGTDCSVAMALKGAIVEAGELRGFEMTCSVRSQSEARSTFQVSLSPHPSFAIPELPALALEPGQVGEVVIPIRWDRSVKDNNGWNHPAIFELAVPVSNGRRTSRMRWELIEGKLEPFINNGAVSTNGTATAPHAAVKTERAAAAPASPVETVVAPAANPQPAAAVAKPEPVAPVATPKPEAKPAAVEPVKTATVTPMPAPATKAPAAAAASATVMQTASTPAAKPMQPKVSVTPAAPLMLNGFVEHLMLAAPVDAKPTAAPAINGASAIDRVEVAKKIEVVELSLFPVKDRHGDVARKPAAAADQKVTPQPQATPAAQPAPKQLVPEQSPSKQPAPAQSSPQQSTPAQPATAPASPPQSAPAKPELSVAPATTPPAPAQPKPSEEEQKTEASAPQWKIVTAAESFAAAAEQAKSAPAPQAPVVQAPVAQTPVAQAPVAAAPTAPAPASPTPATDANASAQTAPQPAPSGPPPKLTPYAAAKWDATAEADAPVQAARPTPVPAKASAATEITADATSAPAASQTSAASRAMRERHTIEALAQRRPRPGLVIGGLAAVAIVVGIFIFRPSPQTQAPSTTPVAVAPPVVAVNPTNAVKPAVVRAHVAVKPTVMVKPTANVAATSAPAATPKPATPNPATAVPATPKPAAQKPPFVAARPRPAPRHVARYGKLYQPESGSVVALGGIEAYYGPRGRAVRVIWSANEQASASVSLIDDRGTTVNSVSVRGGRQSVILYLPRGYRGGLTVQVSSIGRLGERVAQTTSLPAFGN